MAGSRHSAVSGVRHSQVEGGLARRDRPARNVAAGAQLYSHNRGRGIHGRFAFRCLTQRQPTATAGSSTT
jgi:hypothetical protein